MFIENKKGNKNKMTNLEWLIKEKPEIAMDCLSRTYLAIKVNKDTGDIGMCDDDCCNCLFSDPNCGSEDCIYRITDWLRAEHKNRKSIKDLTQKEVENICDHRSVCKECELRLSNGHCYYNIIREIKENYNITTVEEIVDFGKKIVEV